MSKVRVISPSGKVGLIPQDKLQEALNRGAKLADEPRNPSASSMQPPEQMPVEPGESLVSRVLRGAGESVSDFTNTARNKIALGWGDELAGVGGAIGETAGALMDGDLPTVDDIKNAYNTSRQEELDSIKASEERSPVSSFVGNVAGSSIGLAASGLAGAGQKLGVTVLPKLAPATAGALGTGVLAGAVEGAGNAKNIEDIPTNTAIGAGVGLAGAAAGLGLGKVAKRVFGPGQNEVLAEQMDEAYKLGKQGEGSGVLVREKLGDVAADKAKVVGEIADDVSGINRTAGKAIEDGLEKASRDTIGSRVYVEDSDAKLKLAAIARKFLNSAPEDLGISPAEHREVVDTLRKMYQIRAGDFTPAQANVAQKNIRDIAQKLFNTDKVLQADLEDTVRPLLRDAIEQSAPGYLKNLEVSSKVKGAIEKGFGKDIEFFNKDTVERGARRLVDSQKTESIKQATAKNNLEGFIEELRKLGPEKVRELGIDPDKLAQSIGDKIKNVTTREAAAQPMQIPLSLKGLTNLGNTAKLRAANTAGAVSNSAVARTTRSLFDAPREALDQFSQKLVTSSDPLIRKYGEALATGLEKGTFYRNAALFNIMQNPVTRDLAKGITGLDAEEE